MLTQGNDMVSIPGTRRVRIVDENIGALDVDLTWTCGHRPHLPAAGHGRPPRYNEVSMAGTDL